MLFWRIRRTTRLRQPIQPTRASKAPTGEDELIITPKNRHLAAWPQGANPCQTCHVERPFGFIDPPPQGTFPPNAQVYGIVKAFFLYL